MLHILCTSAAMLCVTVCASDRVQEGIRDLEVLKDKRDINLCSTIALMFAHKRSSSLGN